MFKQQVLSVQELLKLLQKTSEFFCIIVSFFPKKCYQVAFYKYDNQYYVLQNPDLLQLTNQQRGKESLVLDLVDETMENNQYKIVSEDLIRVDLNTLASKEDQADNSIFFFQFE